MIENMKNNLCHADNILINYADNKIESMIFYKCHAAIITVPRYGHILENEKSWTFPGDVSQMGKV